MWEEAGQSVRPTWLGRPLLGLAVLAQLGISHGQLGSGVTFCKGMNGQVGAGKRETRAGTARGWQEGSQPGKPFWTPPWRPETTIARMALSWLLKY